MYSLRKWIFKPKKTDQSVLAQFFYADEELNLVAAELDSFDGRKDPERCTALVNQLRVCQDKVLGIVERIMEEAIPLQRANRDFRVKFPDDVLQESLAGQLWFGAECLAAGSSIMNREVESASMRPLAKALTRHLDFLRSALRDQCLRNINSCTDKIKEALVVFDRLFAEFELSYVSAMVPVKSMKEYDVMQDVIVLFCETTLRALRLNLITQDMIDDYDPAIMFTIPRLAIVCGLLVFPEGPLNPDMDPVNMSEMFRPFQTLLYKIRELLWTLSKDELWLLEKSLCSAEEPGLYRQGDPNGYGDDDGILEGSAIPPAFYANYPDVLTNGGVTHGITHISQSESGNHLSVERVEYNFGGMSQSPSTMTVVANPNYKGPQTEDDGAQEDSGDKEYLSVESTQANIRHQDSSDSGMLSGNGSLSETAHPMSMFEPSGSADLRMLRHSLSWPESSHRCQHCRRSLSESLDRDDFDEDLPGVAPHHHGSHEFNFHLPLNTQTGSNSTHPKTIPVISLERNTPPESETGLAARRIYITSDSFEEEQQISASTAGPHISFVTDTLNEVFVTDVSFQDVGSTDANGNPTCPKESAQPENDKEQEIEQNCPESGASCQGAHVGESTLETVSQADAKGIVVTVDCSDSSDCERDNHKCQNGEDLKDEVTENTDAVKSSEQICENPVVPSNEKDEDSPVPSSDQSSDSKESCIEQESDPQKTSTVEESVSNSKPSELEMDVNHFEEKRSLEESTQDLIITPPTVKSDRSSTHACSTCPGHSSGVGKKGECKSKPGACLEVPRIQCVKYADSVSSTCSSCQSRSHSPSVASVECDWDRESYASSETSSYNSECHDDEEIALAIQAAELAARREARSRFKSSGDLIHRLFVCISGVADQLQTNYASDLRHILKAVFECTASEPFLSMDAMADDILSNAAIDDADGNSENGDTASIPEERNRTRYSQDPPAWVPDDQSPHCTTCKVPFTFVRRRHHCRNCGKIFCGRCSSNAVPLPHYGHAKPVRVCNHCFIFQVTPFTVNE